MEFINCMMIEQSFASATIQVWYCFDERLIFYDFFCSGYDILHLALMTVKGLILQSINI